MHIADLCAPRKICRWCGEPYFTGAEISISVILPQMRLQVHVHMKVMGEAEMKQGH
jgi:hypothetical protein